MCKIHLIDLHLNLSGIANGQFSYYHTQTCNVGVISTEFWEMLFIALRILS